MLGKCLGLGADSIIIDLEDAVKNTPHDKAAARKRVKLWLEANLAAGKKAALGANCPEILIRINPTDSDYWRLDLHEVCNTPVIDGLVLPKVERKGDIHLVESELSKLSQANPSITFLPIVTETPDAVFNLKEIVASSPRITAVTWGCEDLSAVVGSSATRNPKTGE